MSVKPKKRGRPFNSSKQLSNSIILKCAKSMLEEEGKIPAIRGLAAKLNVDAMAIYHYFANKNALLEAIASSLVTEIYEPKNDRPWKTEIYSLCYSYLKLLKDYNGLLETMLSSTCFGPSNVFTEKFSQITDTLGLSPATAITARDLLVDYLHGFAFAMQLNKRDGEIELEMIKGPINLYFGALEKYN